jgi:hypothetical protein
MITVGLLVRLVAKPGKEAEVTSFLEAEVTSALESGVWLISRNGVRHL